MPQILMPTLASLRRRPLWSAAVVGGVAFLGLQLVRPALPNPPVDADLDAPAPVKSILRASCYDCHSNETKLPWYDEIVPAYWLVAYDVREGRQHLNFSDIGRRTAAQQRAALYESVNHILLGAMPPRTYTRIHPHAVVTPEQLAVLEEYLRPSGGVAPTSPPPASAPVAPIPIVPSSSEVRPAPNGIAFVPGYKDWRVMSTTFRFDNHTLRVITANDIAMNAIAASRTRPWPDGAAFAKIAWAPDAEGRAAEFKQVELMIKDAKAYRDTSGWGWARWVGRDLRPYGEDASFTRECTGCHAPVEKNDFVFSFPLRKPLGSPELFNVEAALPDGLPFDPLAWQVVSSSVDAASQTMSTVYGNAAAVVHARSGRSSDYPAGAVLARVTWARRDDPHWFGAQIPGRVQSVEVVTAADGPDGKQSLTYDMYAGAPLARSAPPEASILVARRGALLEHPSPLP